MCVLHGDSRPLPLPPCNTELCDADRRQPVPCRRPPRVASGLNPTSQHTRHFMQRPRTWLRRMMNPRYLPRCSTQATSQAQHCFQSMHTHTCARLHGRWLPPNPRLRPRSVCKANVDRRGRRAAEPTGGHTVTPPAGVPLPEPIPLPAVPETSRNRQHL